MPQTTIYASPRSVGAPHELPPAVATHELARALPDAYVQTSVGTTLHFEAG